jgi:hypothetical protein
VLLLALVALVAWPTSAQAQTLDLTLANNGSVTGLGSSLAGETITVNYNTPSAGDYTINVSGATVINVTDNSVGVLVPSGSGTSTVTIAPGGGTVTSLAFDQNNAGIAYRI